MRDKAEETHAGNESQSSSAKGRKRTHRIGICAMCGMAWCLLNSMEERETISKRVNEEKVYEYRCGTIQCAKKSKRTRNDTKKKRNG